MGGDTDSRPLVMVDVDTGTDDALALLMLLAADNKREIQLLGITCVAGNTTLPNVCYNTLRILKATNRLDIPVFSGAAGPLLGNRYPSDYHGSDGFGDVPKEALPVQELLQEENAVVALHRIVTQHKGRVTLICLAPLTNIALAMRTFPDFSTSVKQFYIMGGNVYGLGNVTPHAEFNFFADPEAAHIVLECAACPVTLTPWETCRDHPMSLEWRWNKLGAKPSPGMELLNAAERSILGRLKWDHWVACDQFAVSNFLRPEVAVKTRASHASVELQGKRTRGQLVQMNTPANQDSDTPNCEITLAYDLPAIQDLMLWCAERWTSEP